MSDRTDWSTELDDVDDATVQLMLQLHLQDVDELTSQSSPSARAALLSYEVELKQYRAIRKFEGEETALAEASALAAFQEDDPPPPMLEPSLEPTRPVHVATFHCIACDGRFDIDHCFPAPCEHYYCDDDLETLFHHAMTDRSLYPPRCCRREIPFDDVKLFLSAELVSEFSEKKEELDDTKPTYCHIPTCSTYIGASGKKDSNIATCPSCTATTCILCQQASHAGDCEEDSSMQELLQLAEREGWRKCPGCGRMIELNMGCYHMTCPCSAQFCYLCGVRWKNCSCIQFEEQRLLARGQQIAEREGRGDVQHLVHHLRDHHDCVEHRWEWATGRHECDDCGDSLPRYIFRCRDCHTQNCRRCRFNRG